MIADFSLKDVPPYYGLFIIGVLLLIVGLRHRKMRRKSPKETAVLNQKPAAATDVRAMADELNRLFAELQETARRLAAQVQNRATRLEILIAEADEKIKRLEALQGNADRTGGTPADNTPPLQTTRGVTGPVEDPKYQRIYELSDGGKSAREIAQEVGAPPGEVELILNLRGKVMRA